MAGNGRKTRAFGAAVVLFVGWAAWLAYQLAATGKPIVVSRPQMVMAPIVIEAEVKADGDRPAAEVRVTRVFRGDALLGIPAGGKLPKDLKLPIGNLSQSRGWRGPGEYILPLRKRGAEAPPKFDIVPVPFSPGFNPSADLQALPIYPADDSTRGQLLDALR